MDESARILEHLSRVVDPEIPVLTLRDMGILRGVRWDEKQAQYLITISPTYVGCPAMDRMEQDIREAMYVLQLPFDVETQLKPAWTTSMITAEGRRKMEEYGIAPPVEGSADKRVLFAEPPVVKCPRCKSKNTHMVSMHGSTACKSAYTCKDCLEPFEYFKCL